MPHPPSFGMGYQSVYLVLSELDMHVVRFFSKTCIKNFYNELFKISLIWNITRISTVKLVFSFCANAKFKEITCIVNLHYHVFDVPQRFYSNTTNTQTNGLTDSLIKP